MQDEDKNKLREQQRASFDCETPVTPEAPNSCDNLDSNRVASRIDPCDPSEVCVHPDLKRPNAKPIVQVLQLLSPAPLEVGNDQRDAYCPVDKFGPTSSVLANAIIGLVDWRIINDISPSQLDRIARISNPDVILGLDPEVIQSLTKLYPPQITQLIAAITDLKTQLNETAQITAQQALDCWYENVAVEVECPAGALENDELPGSPPSLNFQASVAAGTYRSYISQSEADNLATDLAESLLVCCYGNSELTRTCQDLGFSEDVSEAGVISVTIPANTFFSCESPEIANDLAELSAIESLDCFYGSEEIDIECPDQATYTRTLDGYTLSASFEDIGPADYVTSQPGTSVFIPEGAIASSESVAAATLEANLLAESLLVCGWQNDEIEFSCPEEAKPNSVTATLGVFKSLFSAQEVLDQLENFLTASLQCIFCNTAIEPLCTEGSLDATAGIAAGIVCADTLEEAQAVAENLANIPLKPGPALGNCTYGNDEVIRTCEDKVLSTVGLDPRSTPTITIPANSYQITSSDPVAGKAAANALAETAALAGLDCFFANPEGTFYCGFTGGSGSPYIIAGGDGSGVSSDSSGSTARPIVVAADTFTSTVSADEVNLQIIGFVTALLDCFYYNEEITIRCNPDTEDIDDGLTLIGTGTLSDSTAVSAAAAGSISNPVIVQAGTTTSYTSQAAANTLAAYIGVSGLDCYLENAEVEWTCADSGKSETGLAAESNGASNPIVFPAGYFVTYKSLTDLNNQIETAGKASVLCLYINEEVEGEPCSTDPIALIQVNFPTLPAGTVISTVSQADATDLAQALVNGMVTCINPDEVGGGDGSPGNDGAQTACDGECFGFYS